MGRWKMQLGLAVLLVLLAGNVSRAQGTIEPACGYPKPSCSGGIEVAGTVTLDCGWEVKSINVLTWQDGGVITTTKLFGTCTIFSGMVTGLDSTTAYNVTMEAVLINPCDPCAGEVAVRTALTTVTTK